MKVQPSMETLKEVSKLRVVFDWEKRSYKVLNSSNYTVEKLDEILKTQDVISPLFPTVLNERDEQGNYYLHFRSLNLNHFNKINHIMKKSLDMDPLQKEEI
ncbi:MAG: hypothetical protein Tsb0021_15740 [Chlamydiales bacterium]